MNRFNEVGNWMGKEAFIALVFTKYGLPKLIYFALSRNWILSTLNFSYIGTLEHSGKSCSGLTSKIHAQL